MGVFNLKINKPTDLVIIYNDNRKNTVYNNVISYDMGLQTGRIEIVVNSPKYTYFYNLYFVPKEVYVIVYNFKIIYEEQTIKITRMDKRFMDDEGGGV